MTVARCPHCGGAIDVALSRPAREAVEVRDELADRVLAYITEREPCSVRAVRRDVQGGSIPIDAALRSLQDRGVVVRDPDGLRSVPGTPGTAPEDAEAPEPTAPATQTFGDRTCPDCRGLLVDVNGTLTCFGCTNRERHRAAAGA